MKGQSVWIVGRAMSWHPSGWEFAGIFDTEEEAREACITDKYFIGPATIGERIPDEKVEWPCAYYPKAR